MSNKTILTICVNYFIESKQISNNWNVVLCFYCCVLRILIDLKAYSEQYNNPCHIE